MKFLKEVGAAAVESSIHRELLPGGALLLAEQVEAVPSLALGIWIRSGSRDEQPDEVGIAHFIEHMVYKGTRRHSAYQLAKRMEALGGMVDAWTTKETTCFYARVFGEHVDPAISILAELVSEPAFRADMVEREREVVEEEIQSYEDTPEEKVQDLAAELLYGERHPLGRPILGTVESLRSISPGSLRRFHRVHYSLSNVILTAAGNFDLARLRNTFQERLRLPNGSRRRVTSSRPARRAAERHEERDLQQVSLCLVRRGASARHRDRHAQAILNTILGAGMSSRLFQRIREDAGLAYTVYSYSESFRDTGMFGIYLGCAPAKLGRAFGLIQRELAKIKSGGVHRWELESARAQMLTTYFLSFESMYERINRLAQSEIHYDRQVSMRETLAGVASVTQAQVKEAAAELFEPDAWSLVTLGPSNGSRPTLASLDF